MLHHQRISESGKKTLGTEHSEGIESTVSETLGFHPQHAYAIMWQLGISSKLLSFHCRLSRKDISLVARLLADLEDMDPIAQVNLVVL